MAVEKNRLSNKIRQKLKKYKFSNLPQNTGVVAQAGDGAIKIKGLSQAASMEMLEIEGGQTALALNLEEDEVVAIILGEFNEVREGAKVKATGKLLSIGVSESLLGRVINPIGEALDGKDKLETDKVYPVEKIAPGVIYRHPVDTPMLTGLKAIDSMIPIGRGQRELIIGDRKTGKTAIALDTIINQKGENLICIYTAIGQKTSSVAQIIETLKKNNALDYTVIVSSSANDSASLQFIAPYAACAIGEYFMDQGKDALVIYDDLSKHAWAYREISLILRRPSGREAYPGDVFYLHSRLLERACRMDKKYGGGSLTALPIVETQAGDISAYIPTNVISITDGQIFLDSDLFYAGMRPAINIGLSVSRVGGAAQTKAMKQVAGKLKLELAQYRELSAFVQFASELDPKTKKQINTGARLTQVLKQKQFEPLSLEKQVAIIWAAAKGYIDDVKIEEVGDFETKYLTYLESMHAKLLSDIRKEKKLDEEKENKLKKATEEFIAAYGNA